MKPEWRCSNDRLPSHSTFLTPSFIKPSSFEIPYQTFNEEIIISDFEQRGKNQKLSRVVWLCEVNGIRYPRGVRHVDPHDAHILLCLRELQEIGLKREADQSAIEYVLLIGQPTELDADRFDREPVAAMRASGRRNGPSGPSLLVFRPDEICPFYVCWAIHLCECAKAVAGEVLQRGDSGLVFRLVALVKLVIERENERYN